jgi:Ca2+-binding EF-hand superfamily protein
MEAEEKLRNLQESKDDLENEFEEVRLRLEQVDQQYRWENAVFNKVVAVLKRHRVSPQQAFEEFDKNKDGKLTRDEFIRSLELLKIDNLSNQEIDILVSSIDQDSDGFVRYKEFERKLSRHGVKSRTPEEQILFLLIESLKRSGIKRLSDAFELFDKERRGSLSREDFKDVFKNMKLRLDDAEVDKFIEHFWRDQKAGIDYEAFLRIFQRYQLRLDGDDQRA